MFNSFLVNQCTLLDNNGDFLDNITKLKNKSLDSIISSTSDIAKTIIHLNLYKAHFLNMISIRMIKFCAKSIFKLLSIVLNDNCINEDKFPSAWKKYNELCTCSQTKTVCEKL